ncbi:MAG: polyprenyl synthetase family protein [Bacteroidetes bacterium]|nr:MAG: polyprenyl synthetase family protein [Bacteroidota bacterium]
MSSSADLRQLTESHIEAMAFESRQPRNLYEPMAYILRLPGKRIRPVLTLLAYQALSGRNPAEALNLACSVELFHNFTLMHDDIMDRAPMRRGQPCVHIKWDENIAILSGDAMFAFSMGLVVKDFPEKAAILATEFTRVGMEVCEGQMEDMDLAAQSDAGIPEYIEMIRKKTAALLGGCLSLGALAGDASPELAFRFRQYGELLGIAFQLQDDLMDAFPPEGFGKQVGGDIIENKKTYLLLKARELAGESQLRELDALSQPGTDPAAKVQHTLRIFRELDIENLTQALIRDYFGQALAIGEELEHQSRFAPIKAYLTEIAGRKV